MSFGNLCKSTALIGCLVGSGVACANMGELNPYVGLDYSRLAMKGKGEWSDILDKNYNRMGFVVGSHFHENFKLELGYRQSGSESKSKTFADTAKFGNIQLTNTNGTPTVKGKIKVSSMHMDVKYIMMMEDHFSGLVSVGLAYMKPKFSSDVTPTSVNGTSIKDQLDKISGKNKFVPRLGLGVEYMINNMFSVSAMAHWEGTSGLRFKGADTSKLTDKPFKDGYSFTLGVTYSI